jgi:hypothetical protein
MTNFSIKPPEANVCPLSQDSEIILDHTFRIKPKILHFYF